MKKLYFVRHGLSEMNLQGLIAGSSETPLTAKGKAQAKAAGQQAKDLSIDYIVSSPQSRALETAQIIAKEIGYPTDKIHINDLLVERHYGVLEGTPWLPDMNLDGIADAETLDTILERSKLAIEFLKSIEADNILVVSHGGIGRAMRHHLVPDMPFTNTSSNSKTKLNNAEVVQWI